MTIEACIGLKLMRVLIFLQRVNAVMASVMTSVPLRITFETKNIERSNIFFNTGFILKVLQCWSGKCWLGTVATEQLSRTQLITGCSLQCCNGMCSSAVLQ